MKTKGRLLQRACKTRWLSSEAAVRAARSEILAIWAALKQLSETKNDAMRIGLLRLLRTKNFIMVLYLLSTVLPHLIELSKVFQEGCFNFAQMKSSIELCIVKLSDAAAKSQPLMELKAHWESLRMN